MTGLAGADLDAALNRPTASAARVGSCSARCGFIAGFTVVFTLIGTFAAGQLRDGCCSATSARDPADRRCCSSSCSGWPSSAWSRGCSGSGGSTGCPRPGWSAPRSSARSSRCPGCRASARPWARCSRWPRWAAPTGRARWCSPSRTASGSGLPFLVFGLGFRKLIGLHRAVRRNSRWVTRVGGAMLILVGLALVTGAWGDFMNWLRATVGPGGSAAGIDRDEQRPGVLALADQHAHRADAAAPAGRGGRPGLGLAAAQREHRERQRLPARPTRARAAWLDRLWAFDVFASPWFSAIYLLLFTSLVGCLVPRLRQHAAQHHRPAAGRAGPAGPAAPLGARRVGRAGHRPRRPRPSGPRCGASAGARWCASRPTARSRSPPRRGT